MNNRDENWREPKIDGKYWYLSEQGIRHKAESLGIKESDYKTFAQFNNVVLKKALGKI